jgi:hypothetical protein
MSFKSVEKGGEKLTDGGEKVVEKATKVYKE